MDAAATSVPATAAPSTPSATAQPPDTTEAAAPATTDAADVEPTPSTEPPDGPDSEPIATDVDDGAEAAAGAPRPPVLDVWAPADAQDAPVLVAFHGVPTDRMVTAELAAELARRGYVVVNVEWQLDDTFATGVVFQDACAVRFVREHAEPWAATPTT